MSLRGCFLVLVGCGKPNAQNAVTGNSHLGYTAGKPTLTNLILAFYNKTATSVNNDSRFHLIDFSKAFSTVS